MKTLGIIGGMSPESTALYYRIINREVNRRLGGNHSADIVMHSVDFEEVVRLQKAVTGKPPVPCWRQAPQNLRARVRSCCWWPRTPCTRLPPR